MTWFGPKLERHCVPCGQVRLMVRVLQSRPLYECTVCAHKKELSIVELERIPVHLRDGVVRKKDSDWKTTTPARARTTAAPAPHPTTTNRRQPVPKLNPLQVAIAAAVEGQIRPLEDRINALEEQLKNADARVAAAVEAAIAGLLAPVAKPAAEAGETIAECRHKNRMKKCTSCQARVKAEGGA